MSQSKKKPLKERVLHTRVSEKLDAELREKAAGLGVSVSNLVRNILLNTVEMVEDIVADGSSIARAAGRGRPSSPSAPDTTPAIVGWQELTLNLNALCSECNAILPMGSIAKLAVYSPPSPANAAEFHCCDCVDKRLLP